MNAVKQAVFLFLSLIALASSGWYFAVSPNKFKLDAETLIKTSDTVINDLSVQQYSPEGELINSLQTPLLRHIPKNNTHWIKTPHIVIKQSNQPAWEINAEHAIALYGGEKITFYQSVRIHQSKSEHNKESTFTTERITYFPKTKLALTSKDILFEQPGSRVQSKGMRANLEKKHIQLLSQTRGVYDPKQG